MKILNLYAGIGGNRKLWGDEHEVTAVELNPDIAAIYQNYFPDDTVIVADAHQYLLDHYKDFDFIWASPPCPTHSDIRRRGVHGGQYQALYPDMSLYQEIILLQNFAPKATRWVIENVIPYYEYLIKPHTHLGRHPFWSNFVIRNVEIEGERRHNDIVGSSMVYGFKINNTILNARKILRNLVNPEIGAHILNCAMGKKPTKTTQTELQFPEKNTMEVFKTANNSTSPSLNSNAGR